MAPDAHVTDLLVRDAADKVDGAIRRVLAGKIAK
jgi:hypothetical protein